VWSIDKWGRRGLLLFTFPNMAWSLLVAGCCLLIDESSRAHVALVALFVFVRITKGTTQPRDLGSNSVLASKPQNKQYGL
jgi:hypothetical protein